jgi:hypothetical protein
MTTQNNATAYGRNFDGTAGDVLERLKALLDSTPPHALATRPLRRSLLEAAVAEIERLRAAVDRQQP